MVEIQRRQCMHFNLRRAGRQTSRTRIKKMKLTSCPKTLTYWIAFVLYASGHTMPVDAGEEQSQPELDYHQTIVLPGGNANHLQSVPVPAPVTAAAVAGGCANPIVCENQLPGTPPSDWSIVEPGDPSIVGFATEVSVNVGETVHFKVNTNASAYHIDILRMGWYQGNGARKIVAGLRPSARLPQKQPNCIIDNSNTTGLIDCGNWAESASWDVPATAVSGVYLARLVRDDSSAGSSYIFFNVRNDASRADIVYQTSDTTRAAYNTYGGNSLYQCQVACPPGNPHQYKGAYKISFNRPNVAVSQGMEYSFFSAEFQLVEFLEANGYDVTYISGVDTDRAGALLKNHRLFISSGQDEYWSGAQRANVEAARDGNPVVNLAFFSGNEVFWKTRYEASIDGRKSAYRTLVTYKETHFDAPRDPLDPPIWTGTWRDGRFSPPGDGGRPENGLTGTIFTVDSPGGDFPIEVPAADGKMRFWRNSAVAAQSAGQTVTLSPNTLGYEWDEDLDNGARPAGIVHLSTTTHNVPRHVVDTGSTEVPGAATHHLTLHRAASGALVFGAGTVQWSWGLEGSPDGSAPANASMQQATVNLLADMGVQPATLIAQLTPASISTDSTAPVSVISSPSAGTTVQTNSVVTIIGTASDSGGGVVGGVEVSTDGGTSWHPASGRESWIYQWTPTSPGSYTLRSRAVDDSANLETPSSAVTVSVGARSCPCTIWPSTVVPSVTSDSDNAAVEVGVKFFADTSGTISAIRFFKSTANVGPHVASLWSANGTLLAQATFTNESASGWQQVNFATPVNISAGTHYVASYHTASGHYADDTGYFAASNFDNPPLHAIKDGTDGGNGVYMYSPDSAFPSNRFQSSNYWVDVVFNPAGQSGGDNCPCSLWQASAQPVLAAEDDSSAVELGVKFRSDFNGLITGVRFYKSASNTGTHVGNLWSAGGTLLATATFTNESASGWQQVTFANPVAITAGTTYVASYHTNKGHYADDADYFTNTGLDSGPLHALRDGVQGPNGVYAYGASSIFPTSGWRTSNYWVDVIFQRSP